MRSAMKAEWINSQTSEMDGLWHRGVFQKVLCSLFSPPGTDLRMDWGDACSLGCLPDLNRYFLLAMDKGTEYFVSFLTKTRASPLALLKQFVTFTA